MERKDHYYDLRKNPPTTSKAEAIKELIQRRGEKQKNLNNEDNLAEERIEEVEDKHDSEPDEEEVENRREEEEKQKTGEEDYSQEEQADEVKEYGQGDMSPAYNTRSPSPIRLTETFMERMMEIMKENQQKIIEKVEENNKEIQQLEEKISKQFEEKLKKHSSNIEKKLAESNRKIENITKEVRENREQAEKQMREMRELVNKNKVELQEEILQTVEMKNSESEKQCKKREAELHMTINESINKKSHELVKQIEKNERSITVLSDKQKEQNNTITQHEVQIQQISRNAENLQEQIREVQTTERSNPNIYVTCTGGQMYGVSGPKFSGKNTNPMEFIQRFEKYFESVVRAKSPELTLEEAIEASLEGNVLKWWMVNRDYISNIEQFKKIFLDKYWSVEIQKGMRRRMEVEKYQLGGKLSRAEYFLERVLLLSYVTPKLDEQEIVSILSEHFSDRIQDSRRVQNLNTVQAFERLLDREDIEERHNRVKRREHYNPNTENSQYNYKIPFAKNSNEPIQSPTRNRNTPNQNTWRRDDSEHQSRNHNTNHNHRQFNQSRKNTTSMPYRNETQRSPYNKSYQDNNGNPRYNPISRAYPTEQQKQVCNAIRINSSHSQDREYTEKIPCPVKEEYNPTPDNRSEN